MPNVHMAEATLADAQLNAPEVTAQYQTDEGVTDATMQLGALNRIAESNLAIAYEQRTANLIALLNLANKEDWGTSADAELARTMVIEALDIAPLTEIIDGISRTPERVRGGERREAARRILQDWSEVRKMSREQARQHFSTILEAP